MFSVDRLFSASQNVIELPNLKALILFCRYNPRDTSRFLQGLMLADDLKNEKDVVLYTKGTHITEDRIARLLKLTESYPDMVLKFRVKRSEQLIKSFKKMVGDDFKNLFSKKKNLKIYSQLFTNIVNKIDELLDEILTDENILLTLYKMRLCSEGATSKTAGFFYIHSINTALFSIGIANSGELKSVLDFSKQNFLDLIKAAILHNYGGLSQIDTIIKLPEKEQLPKYMEANRTGCYMLGSLNLGFEVMDAMRLVVDYFFGRKDFINRDDNTSKYANIIVVAEIYSRMLNGLFGDRQKPTYIVDQLNVKAFHKELNNDVVKAFTIGLNLKDIFDFYHEMELLVKECEWKYAVPYPMTGFKSPTIFVCKVFKADCPHLEHSVKAVTLLKPMGGLEEGKYSRCLKATPKLLEFYASHYEEIKEATVEKAKKK
ncbi:hypothetical protein DRQ09_05000 [candidate division KSB1 bacterium]|nr:MAG: hypothetical protein DRQ09_05000 [candidate division KSB1 bacterium]